MKGETGIWRSEKTGLEYIVFGIATSAKLRDKRLHEVVVETEGEDEGDSVDGQGGEDGERGGLIPSGVENL
nr:hypothetical protein Itr_chr08CG10730 [Ipomoea trifida]